MHHALVSSHDLPLQVERYIPQLPQRRCPGTDVDGELASALPCELRAAVSSIASIDL